MVMDYDINKIIETRGGKKIHTIKAKAGELFKFIQYDVNSRDIDIDTVGFGLKMDASISDEYYKVLDALIEQVVLYLNKAINGTNEDNAMYDKVCGTLDDYCEYHNIDIQLEGKITYGNKVEMYYIDNNSMKASKA